LKRLIPGPRTGRKWATQQALRRAPAWPLHGCTALDNPRRFFQALRERRKENTYKGPCGLSEINRGLPRKGI
jgi:hypothetical protein